MSGASKIVYILKHSAESEKGLILKRDQRKSEEFCQIIKGSKNLKDPKGSAKRTPAAFTFRICILVFFKGKIICDIKTFG